jgi:hypothetical protein
MLPLYQAVVHRGRAVHWYVEGGVPDTLDGRFDMIAAVLTLVLLRLEQADLRHESVWLTELFIDDMEGQLRQIGIGDLVVGKHVGRMMSALGRSPVRLSRRTGAGRRPERGAAAQPLSRRAGCGRGSGGCGGAAARVRGGAGELRAGAPAVRGIAGMTDAPPPEFSRVVRLDEIGRIQFPAHLSATAEERAALAARFGFAALELLEGDYSLVRDGGRCC